MYQRFMVVFVSPTKGQSGQSWQAALRLLINIYSLLLRNILTNRWSTPLGTDWALVKVLRKVSVMLHGMYVKQNTCKSQTRSNSQTAESQYSPAGRRRCHSSPGCLPASCSASESSSSDLDRVQCGWCSGECTKYFVCERFSSPPPQR